jgi:hypothetical protein
MGAYEYLRPDLAIPYTWLQQYGLPADGSADFVDSDGDGMSNLQEWIAGTVPTNALSRLAMQPNRSGNGPGITVKWESVTNRVYYLPRSSNLAQPASFSSIRSNIAGQSGVTSFFDSSATNAVPSQFSEPESPIFLDNFH